MKSNKFKFLLFLLILPVLLYFWPAQLYGDTNYVMLLGNSMYPTIESGTFIVVKPDQNYFVGDIIAFVNEDQRNVVHRIVEHTEDGFITKGDNNPKNDPKIIPMTDVLGRAIFVLPYVGFTSLFLQTPIGMSIFGIWALAMFSKKKSKVNKSGNQPFLILKITLVSVLTNYALTQSALAINVDAEKIMTIFFSEYFVPSVANTIYFSLLSMAVFALYFFMYVIQKKESDKAKSLNLLFTLAGVMILAVQIIGIINIVPFFINLILGR